MTTITEVKERPILFSDEMVRAILDGRKTQTRRAGKMRGADRVYWHSGKTHRWGKKPEEPYEGWVAEVEKLNGLLLPLRCPYGQVGDRLWVREATLFHPANNFLYRAGSGRRHYRADLTPQELKARKAEGWRVVPSIHVPKWAWRTVLEITGIRAERVQSISEADALAEGFTPGTCERVLNAAAGGIEPEEAYCAENAKGQENDGWLCYRDAQKWAGKKGYVCWGLTPEGDGPAYCEECHKPLLISLTKYGVERELRIEDDPDGKEPQYFAAGGMDAAIAGMIAGGIGDLREEHHGRLAQIGFATVWEHINGRKNPWKSNPWVWVVEFKRVEVARA